ncbi:hypothetical protein [Microterricola viridarii]|uniref:Uncharacterized protein n=1 Tax=Microterricola viridarii TaxID=412690 RepID=A0A1H1V3U6_9MICO|nr:hypothetical protein [Microterricola viridarii]SDS79373.1 hypothetical protein SAMN04489834_2165 [Microterricola viridarii]
MADVEVKYETKTATTVRGMEARSIEKAKQDGWEFVSQTELPLLRTQLSFRRVKPKVNWTPFLILGGVIVVLASIITVMSIVTGGDDGAASVPAAPTATAQAGAEAEVKSEPAADVFVYEGPAYELITAEDPISEGGLRQYWVLTDKLDYSNPSFKEQVKLIITDVTRAAKTTDIIVQVVTDAEIIEAESYSTFESYSATHDADHMKNVLFPKQATDWVAWYAGGYDYDEVALTGADDTYTLDWLPVGYEGHEKWKPLAEG